MKQKRYSEEQIVKILVEQTAGVTAVSLEPAPQIPG